MPERTARVWALLLAVLLASLSGAHALAQATPQPLMGHGGPVRALALLPDGKTLVSGGFDSAILVWDVATGTVRRVLRFHDSTVNALLALGDGCFASGGEDARIAIWCGEAVVPSRIFAGHQGPISALAALPDGSAIVSASWDRTVRAWDLGTGAARVITEHAAPVNGVAVLADGTSMASASYDGEVRITPKSGAARQRRMQSAINGLAALPGGGLMIAGADGHLRRLDGALTEVRDIALPDGPLTSVAVSPDGRTFATAGLRTPVTLLDAQSGAERVRIYGPGLPVWSLLFSQDNAHLFTGGIDRSVRHWTVATGMAAGTAISAPAASETTPDSDPGARVFRACRACHDIGPEASARAGPSLHGVFGRRIGTAPGYVYSDALTKLDIVWSAETIAKLFELGPNTYTPGTKMPEQRITDADDRKALVDWLARVTRP